MADTAISLLTLTKNLQSTIAANPALQNVWVTAETSDLRVSGGHCYLELIEKDTNGNALARVRATIWASLWSRMSAYFLAQTGVKLASGIKVLVRVNVNFHSSYGLSLNITNIDPSYTLGDAVRRRNEIIAKLRAEGLLERNKQQPWQRPTLNVAVISAAGAAGYGDFVNQLYSSTPKFKFVVRLFPATLQGERTAQSVLDALDAIASDTTDWQCVVIIRGGGATSDLAAFDNYELAARIANFNVPVIVGIGHERDVTVLDYVAGARVKTPTAAAELLIAQASAELDCLKRLSDTMLRSVSERISGNRQQLAYISALIPGLVKSSLMRHNAKLDHATLTLSTSIARVIPPARSNLQHIAETIASSCKNRLNDARRRLDATTNLVKALSPEHVLNRGFSLTRTAAGKIVTDVTDITQGTTIVTTLKNGELSSTITDISIANKQ